MAMTISPCAVASAAEPATLAPSFAAALSASGAMSYAMTPCPFFTRLASIGRPMVPAPRNAIFMMMSSRGGRTERSGTDRTAHGAAERAIGNDGRVLARATGHDHEDLVGREHLRHQGIVVADGPHPRGPVVHAPHAAQLEESEGQAGVLVDELLNVAPREAIAGHGHRV